MFKASKNSVDDESPRDKEPAFKQLLPPIFSSRDHCNGTLNRHPLRLRYHCVKERINHPSVEVDEEPLHDEFLNKFFF